MHLYLPSHYMQQKAFTHKVDVNDITDLNRICKYHHLPVNYADGVVDPEHFISADSIVLYRHNKIDAYFEMTVHNLKTWYKGIDMYISYDYVYSEADAWMYSNIYIYFPLLEPITNYSTYMEMILNEQRRNPYMRHVSVVARGKRSCLYCPGTNLDRFRNS